MDRNKNTFNNQSNDSLDIFAAKLTYIGSSISTLGDGIQTIAAGLALEWTIQMIRQNKMQT